MNEEILEALIKNKYNSHWKDMTIWEIAFEAYKMGCRDERESAKIGKEKGYRK